MAKKKQLPYEKIEPTIGHKGHYEMVAERASISPQAFSGIRGGYKPCGRKVATRLEEATGLPKESWMFPNDHPDNPYMEQAREYLSEQATTGA